MSQPASIPALKGMRSSFFNCSRVLCTCGISLCVSPSVDPCPGKCLRHDTDPASCNPFTALTTCVATLWGFLTKRSYSNDRRGGICVNVRAGT